MSAAGAVPGDLPAAGFLVADPGGRQSRVLVESLPFLMGRQPENHLVLRDARISRVHARVVAEDGEYYIEDLKSRNGVFVNGDRVERHKLTFSDRIEFGVPDSYRLVFTSEDSAVHRLTRTLSAPAAAGGGDMARLRAVVELARTLETSFSSADVLTSLVDTALAVTGAERGFLLLCKGDELDFHVARDRNGAMLSPEDLRVPRGVIRRALNRRRDLLSMSFGAGSGDSALPMQTIAELELRSVVCVPLIKLGTGTGGQTQALSPADETVGLLYCDSRAADADLSAGNRELLQTLALEASTILENARLLEKERMRQRMEEELRIAREIQESLLPRNLPADGWLRAAARNTPSHQVGGDYFDLHRISPESWALINADVSGKGISSALLASFLQGAYLAASQGPVAVEDSMGRLNRFLIERTEGQKYATIFCGTVNRSGQLHFVNAGHCPPLVVRAAGGIEPLESTSLPVGLLEEAVYQAAESQLYCGDMLVLYTDGVTEAENLEGEPFDDARLREVTRANRGRGSQALLDALGKAVADFTEGAFQKDDITLMVLEYSPEAA